MQNTKLKGEIVNIENDCRAIEAKIRQKENVLLSEGKISLLSFPRKSWDLIAKSENSKK